VEPAFISHLSSHSARKTAVPPGQQTCSSNRRNCYRQLARYCKLLLFLLARFSLHSLHPRVVPISSRYDDSSYPLDSRTDTTNFVNENAMHSPGMRHLKNSVRQHTEEENNCEEKKQHRRDILLPPVTFTLISHQI